MNRFRLIFQSLRFYKKTNLSVVLGVLVSSAVLTGALIIGDSVRYSLVRMAEMRSGSVESALLGGERMFTAQLAEEFQKSSGIESVSLLMTRGIVVAEKNSFRVNKTAINGYGHGFWKAGNAKSSIPELKEDEVFINQRLAEKTGLNAGDELLVKIRKPNAIPGDMTLTPKESDNVSFRATVKKVLSEDDFGNFSIRNNQVPPYSVFIPISELNKKLDLKNRANVVLFAGNSKKVPGIKVLAGILKNIYTPADISLELKKNNNSIDIVSERIFIDSYIEKNLKHLNPVEVLTYFVNSVEYGDKVTPYSFITAFRTPPEALKELKKDEVVLNRWVAEDLGVKTGDKVKLKYFVPDKGDTLETKDLSFTVRSITDISGYAADGTLMPILPGIVDEESCRDWDPGIPIDLAMIRQKDEKYWEKYKGTPKGFINFDTATTAWANRFGRVTMLRFPAKTDKETLIKDIRSVIDPLKLGFTLVPLKEEGHAAGSEAVDFGELFLGLSFFIIAAALILTALLASLSAEQRRSEHGVLLALGFTPSDIRRVLFTETALIAFIGALPGVVAGIFYNKLVLWFLGTIWRGATGTANLHMHIRVESLIIGFGVSFITALLAIWFTVKKHSHQSISAMAGKSIVLKGRISLNFIIAGILSSGALYLALTFKPQLGKDVSAIFQGIGFLLLGAVIAVYRGVLQKVAASKSSYPSIKRVSWRNIAAGSGRSVTATALIAAGVFTIVSVGANRHTTSMDNLRSSGTGGFSMIGELSVPIKYNLNESSIHGINLKKNKTSFLQFRTHKGDDASCLNLNRISRPTIIATNPEELFKREAFSFAGFDESIPEINRNWRALYGRCRDGSIPAIADMTVIIWGLGKKPGDTVEYTNEKGESIKLKLIAGLKNSIFQGNIIISEENFVANFPSNSGTELFLVDLPADKMETVKAKLASNLEDYGSELTETTKRLAEFNTIENTYLSIFLALGGLGLIIGTIGIGTVLTRNIHERKSELALLMATGFSIETIKKLLIKENLTPFISGITAGTITALIAILPSLLNSGKEIPWIFLITTIALITLNGYYWINRAVTKNCTPDITNSLRNE